ncbi:MAG: hypothetical protein WKF56_00485 [Candidatus Limnocylindrales bacterium]
MNMTIKAQVTPITDRDVRTKLRRTVERVGEERDPLGLQPANVVDQRVDRADPFEALIEAMLPVVPTTGTANQAVRNAAARREFFAEFPTFTSADVARAAGSAAKNVAALATRWRKEGRVFAVPWGGELRYPAFQFDDDGAPLPTIKPVLEILTAIASHWQVALWFATPSPYLPRDARPIQVMLDPDRLLAAAQAERDLPEF